VTTSLARITGTTAGRPPGLSGGPVSGWAFTGLAVTSAGGSLALAALSAPAMVADASASAGLAMLAARHGGRRLPAWGLTVIATGFAFYGLWFTFQQAAT
jgi:hypothetical protein